MLTDLINFLEESFATLLAIFITVLISIIITRIIVRVSLIFARKKYQDLIEIIESTKHPKSKKVIPKEDSEKFIQKENQRGLVEKIKSQDQINENIELNETKIVDFVKPVGFWTSMILGQKLTYLVSSAKIMNKNSDKGFWESMVEAQEKAQGRQKG
ncbi:MAG: hypothetical protein ACJAVG_000959, partial [Rickettsiales bacterium]